jgi:hypothetical protein
MSPPGSVESVYQRRATEVKRTTGPGGPWAGDLRATTHAVLTPGGTRTPCRRLGSTPATVFRDARRVAQRAAVHVLISLHPGDLSRRGRQGCRTPRMDVAWELSMNTR